MSRLRLRVSKSAARDFVAIGQFTLKRWGDALCQRYLAALDLAMHSLLRNPGLGRPCDDIRAGYRRLLCGRHVVFYKVGTTNLDVIRVLHERMLPKAHLDESAD